MADLTPATGALRRSMAPPAGATRPGAAAAASQHAGSAAAVTSDAPTAGASFRRGTIQGTSTTPAAHPTDRGTATTANFTGTRTNPQPAGQPSTPAASPARTGARPGRVLRAIVPGGSQTGQGTLPVANRLLSDDPAAGHPGAGNRAPVDVPVRRQVAASVRPQHLPPVLARSNGIAASSASAGPPTQSAATRGSNRSHPGSSGTPPVRRSSDGGVRTSTGRQHRSTFPGTTRAAAGTPVIRRSPAMPTTVGAAAAQRERAETAGIGTQPVRLPGGLAAAASGTGASTNLGHGNTDQARTAGPRGANPGGPRGTKPGQRTGIAQGAATSGKTAQLGAFVNRSMVVAPPRVSIRQAEPAAAGPPVPATARPDSASRPSARTAQSEATHHRSGPLEEDGPVIRRSLAGTAHSLFRSLLRNPGPGGPGPSSDPVPSGSTGMFESFQHAHGADEPPTIRRLHESPGSAEFSMRGHDAADDSQSPAMRARDFDELIDRIVAKLEQRITDDLERRGRRHLPEVF